MNENFNNEEGFANLIISGLEDINLKKKSIEKLENDINSINNKINNIPKNDLLKLFEKLDYPTAKYLFNELLYSSIHDKNYIDKLTEVVNKKKLDAFPELKIAHYFPEINTLNYLTNEEKRELDEFLAGQSVNRALTPKYGFNLIIRPEYYLRAYEDVCKLGICKRKFDLIHIDELKRYEYEDDDEYYAESIDEIDLNNLIKSFEIVDRLKNGTASEEDISISSSDVFSPYIGLQTEDGYKEITSLNEFNEKVIKREKYANRVMIPNTTTIDAINTSTKLDKVEFFIRLRKQLIESN